MSNKYIFYTNMEYQTKNKIFNSIIQPIVVYLENANFDVTPSVFNNLDITINDLLRQNIINDEQNYVDKFLVLHKQIKITSRPSESDWRKFVDSLFNLLLKLDEKNVKIINNSIKDCRDHLESLDNTNDRKYLYNWFKILCIKIACTIKILQKRRTEIISNSVSDSLLLRIMQLVSCTQLTMNLAKQEISNVVIKESRRFIIKRFIHCLDDIKTILNDDIIDDCTPGFIQWMDNSLEHVSTIEPNENIGKNIENAKSAVDEVLCHAMSLAQIASADDCKMIKASIQTVLYQFGQLQTESNKSTVNPSLCNLFVDIVGDKLCMLERRVNTAVLNMSLRAFSQFFVPLRNLRDVCEETDKSILQRSEEDLDDLISTFDEHVDCLMQVGLFAIACSINTTTIAHIRDCLASLESLESELVPALTTLYMEPSKEADLHAKFLLEYWRSLVQTLRNQVCLIIDPVAFGQVVSYNYKTVVVELKEQLSKQGALRRDDIHYPVYRQIHLFETVSLATIKELKIEENSNVDKHFKNFRKVLNEIKAANENLLVPSYTNRAYSERILKRIQILETMMKRLIQAFAEYEDSKPDEQINQTNQDKLDIINNEIDIVDFANRAQEILKDRSVLYKTPSKHKKLLIPATPTNLLKLADCRKVGISFIRKTVLPNSEDTLDLQLTHILDNLSKQSSILHVPESSFDVT